MKRKVAAARDRRATWKDLEDVVRRIQEAFATAGLDGTLSVPSRIVLVRDAAGHVTYRHETTALKPTVAVTRVPG